MLSPDLIMKQQIILKEEEKKENRKEYTPPYLLIAYYVLINFNKVSAPECKKVETGKKMIGITHGAS